MKSLNVLYYVIQVISVANDSVYPLPRNQYVKEAIYPVDKGNLWIYPFYSGVLNFFVR